MRIKVKFKDQDAYEARFRALQIVDERAAVKSVNGVLPDDAGAITLTPANINAAPADHTHGYVLLVEGTESTENDIALTSEQVADLQNALQNNSQITLILRDGDSYTEYYPIEVGHTSMLFGKVCNFNSLLGVVDVNQALGSMVVARVNIQNSAGTLDFIEFKSGLTRFLPLSLSITWPEDTNSYTLTDNEYAILRQSLLDKRPIFIVRNTADVGGEQTLYMLQPCDVPSIYNVDSMTLILQGLNNSIKVQMADKTIVPDAEFDVPSAVRYDIAQALSDTEKAQARANIGAGTSSAGAFRVNVTHSGGISGIYSADKTFDEIKAAYDAGQQPYVVDNTLSNSGTIYTLSLFLYDESSAQGFADFKRHLILEDAVQTETLRICSYTLASGSNIELQVSEFNAPSGGGGGGSNNAVLAVSNTTGWISKTVAHGGSCAVSLTWSSIENEVATGDGAMKITVNSQVKFSGNVKQGALTVELKDYLDVGDNSVKISITDVYGNFRTLFFNITTVAVSLSSTFDTSSAFTGDITYTYIPVGNVEKTVHFILDGTELATAVVTTSGRQQSCHIPAQSHGAHTFEVYFEATIDGDIVKSNTLYYELICIEEGNTTPIVACAFKQSEIEQYTSVSIPYTVYDPAGLTTQVTLDENGTQVASLTVDRTQQIWSYRAMTIGTVYLTITCGKTKKILTVNVTESTVQIEAETESLALYLSSYGRSNNEENPGTWAYEDVSATFSGFNYSSDGWLLDDDNITVLRVAGDARLTIPYQIFGSDFRTTGKTIEIEFATRDVLNYDAVIMSCFNDNRGLQLTAQKATLRSEQSEISTQYKEDEHVRLAFVVEKKAENRLIYCYINGVMSGVIQYPTDDDFSQSSPVGITIGSNECTMDIYCIRVYDNDLTRFQVLDNWIADTQNITDRLERYQRNAVFNAYGQIVIGNLPRNLPYLILEATELPQYKGDKKTVEGSFTDNENTEQSFTFEAAQADVQGTSSQYYKRKNYKIKFKGGFINSAGVSSESYQMRADAIPTNTFTFKADVASSEGANNVELVRLYNDICPYKTPPQVEDERVRQGIDGFPIVVFWNDGTNTTFLGKYNFNNDKGTPEVFGFTDNDESWEILNNTSDRVLWKSADFSTDDWKNDFEARHPDDSTDVTRLKAFAEWLVSTDQTAATGATLVSSKTYDGTTYTNDTAEYRLAKFKAEFADYAEVDAMIFNYLFTELFLMVDNRAKNAFPTYYDGGKWLILPYDYDTAIGTNNEGALVFSYELEDIDKTSSGADVFNGQNSVLWVNLRQAFFPEIMAMYQKLRSEGKLSYADTEKRFEDHQNKWPEAILNEDSYFKYLAPLIEENSAAYLSMLQGSKAEQRKWWLYNRYRYMDSKYNAGDALTDVITVRGYAKADITVKPYADIYASIKYGSYLVQQRALRGSSYTLACPLDNVNDTEIYIYSASQLADVGDLSGLLVGYAEFSMATKLQSLKIGDSSSSYSNSNLTELYLGNNTLLKTLDVRNCPNLTQAVDVSGCMNIENVYFDGTAITGLNLPNGGILKVLHLPSTITNLTIRNQTAITEFVLPSYANISTLRLENVSSVIDPMAILSEIPENSRVRIIGFDITVDTADEILSLYDRLDTMRGLDENGNNTDKPQMSGTIHVDSLTGAQLAEIQERYPTITIAYSHISSYLYFYSEDGSTLLYTCTVNDGGNGVYVGTEPTKASTAQYRYSFAGWSKTLGGSVDDDAIASVTADRNVYAVFTATVRTYTVKFYNGSTLLQTVNNVAYGGTATYTGETPVSPDGSAEDYPFEGWSPAPTNIKGDTSCYAQFASPLVETISDSWEDIIAACNDGTYATKYSIGDTKKINLGSEGTVCMQIVAFDADTRSDGNGTAHITWISEQLLRTSKRMNPSGAGSSGAYTEGTGAIGGWEKSEMRTYMKETIKPLIPAEVRAAILEVTKTSYAYNTSGTPYQQTTQDDIWLPSTRDLAYSEKKETSGPMYSEMFPDLASHKKHKVGSTSATYWWLRSAGAASSSGVGNNFCYVTSNSGDWYDNRAASISYGVALGFCT